MDVLGAFLTLIIIGVFITIGFEIVRGTAFVYSLASLFRPVETFKCGEEVLLPVYDELIVVKILSRVDKYSYIIYYKNLYNTTVYKRVFGYKLIRK